jgi:hypothetical protein
MQVTEVYTQFFKTRNNKAIAVGQLSPFPSQRLKSIAAKTGNRKIGMV